MKKPVIRSPLEMLPLSTKQMLMGWLTTGGPHGIGISYEAAAKKFHEEHGTKIGVNALQRFYQRHQHSAPATIDTVENATGRTIIITITLPKQVSLFP